MGKKIGNQPKIFNVNWFRTDDEGNFIWPGFGDNLRVLEWIISRCEGKVDARESAIGYIPYAKDINIEGLDINEAVVEDLLTVDNATWLEEVKGIKEFYAQFGDRLPKELEQELKALEERLSK
jgi:phosphoenolpyruvate carboxykinase (GTP)